MTLRILLTLVMLFTTVRPLAAAPPQPLGADGADELLIPLVDIELGERGALAGLLTSPQGEPAANVPVVLRTIEGIDVPTMTDDEGRFRYEQLVGGMYQLNAENSSLMCRVWAPGTAPPESPPELLLVRSDDIAAGQWGPPEVGNKAVRGFTRAMANPVVATLVVAAAVGIPVAIHNANNDDDNS